MVTQPGTKEIMKEQSIISLSALSTVETVL